jgi:hypothetical protein
VPCRPILPLEGRPQSRVAISSFDICAEGAAVQRRLAAGPADEHARGDPRSPRRIRCGCVSRRALSRRSRGRHRFRRESPLEEAPTERLTMPLAAVDSRDGSPRVVRLTVRHLASKPSRGRRHERRRDQATAGDYRRAASDPATAERSAARGRGVSTPRAGCAYALAPTRARTSRGSLGGLSRTRSIFPARCAAQSRADRPAAPEVRDAIRQGRMPDRDLRHHHLAWRSP